MRRLVNTALLCLALAAPLCACSPRELADVTLIRAMAIDGAGPISLTAVGEAEAGRTVYRAEGEDLSAAQADLQRRGATRLEATHVSQLVLGPEADVPGALWAVAVHRESGCGATVWLAGTEAGALLSAAEDPAGRLKSLEENAGVSAPTVLEALSDLEREGRVTLPVLELAGQELRPAGERVVEKGDAF